MEKYQSFVEQRAHVRESDNREEYFAARIVTEGSEVLDEVMRPNKDTAVHREKLLLECGDTLFYVSRLLTNIGATFEECVEANVEKLLNRDQFGKGKKGLRS